MSITRSRHEGRLVARPASPLSAEWLATRAMHPSETADGWLNVCVDVQLGPRQSVELLPQVAGNGGDWYGLLCFEDGSTPPVVIRQSGRFHFAVGANTGKGVRLLVRGVGAKLDGATCAVDFRWRNG